MCARLSYIYYNIFISLNLFINSLLYFCKILNLTSITLQITKYIRKRRGRVNVSPAPGGAEHRLYPRADGLLARAPLLGGGVAGAAARHACRGRRGDCTRAAAFGRLPEPSRSDRPELGLGFGEK